MVSVPVVRGGKNSTYARYLFEYRFDNAEWGLEISAASPAEAQERMKALAWAQYRGEIALRVPVPGAGLILRIKTALREIYGRMFQPT